MICNDTILRWSHNTTLLHEAAYKRPVLLGGMQNRQQKKPVIQHKYRHCTRRAEQTDKLTRRPTNLFAAVPPIHFHLIERFIVRPLVIDALNICVKLTTQAQVYSKAHVCALRRSANR